MTKTRNYILCITLAVTAALLVALWIPGPPRFRAGESFVLAGRGLRCEIIGRRLQFQGRLQWWPYWEYRIRYPASGAIDWVPGKYIFAATTR